MSDLDQPGMAAAINEDAAKLAAMGADPGPAWDHGSHMDDAEKHAALVAHPLYRLGWGQALEAAAALLERTAQEDRDAHGRWADRQMNDNLDCFARDIRELQPEQST